MTSSQTTARIVGLLFLLTLGAAIPAVLLYGPVVDNPRYVLGAGDDSRVLLGAAFEILTIAANIATALVLYPILRRQSETVSLAYVAARLVEATLMILGVVSLIAVVTLRQHGAGADGSALLVADQSLVAINRWTFVLGPGFVAGIGNGLLLGYVMYRSALVPRRLALFGLVGGPMLATSGVLTLLGVIERGSQAQAVATLPEIVWEIGIMGFYLVLKGFRRQAAVLAPDARSAGLAAASTAA